MWSENQVNKVHPACQGKLISNSVMNNINTLLQFWGYLCVGFTLICLTGDRELFIIVCLALAGI